MKKYGHGARFSSEKLMTRANNYTGILVWAWLRGEFKAGLSYIFLSIHDTFKETTN